MSGDEQRSGETWSIEIERAGKYGELYKRYTADHEFYPLAPNMLVKAIVVKPDEIVISRERLREAFDKAYMMPWDDRDGLFDAMASVLFGAEKDTREG